jgi:hypothetical protein
MANNIQSVEVGSVGDLLQRAQDDSRLWAKQGNIRPWYRGQADAGQPLRPSVFRQQYDEFWLSTTFRLKALAFGATIETDRLDQWLFLIQHYGLPTRLLDWTESLMLACFFAAAEAVESERPEDRYHDPKYMAVWMLHPVMLNSLSGTSNFPNTWVTGSALDDFRLAFHPRPERDFLKLNGKLKPTTYPLAVQASAVDTRVVVQRSCFTVFGEDEAGLETMLADTTVVHGDYFRKYLFLRSNARAIFQELDGMGVSFSTVYPDLGGLAKELRFRFRLDA